MEMSLLHVTSKDHPLCNEHDPSLAYSHEESFSASHEVETFHLIGLDSVMAMDLLQAIV